MASEYDPKVEAARLVCLKIGANTYEAGAEQMRERILEKLQIALLGSAITTVERANRMVRALPLAEGGEADG